MSRIALIYLGRKGAGPVFSLELAKALSKYFDVKCFISKNISNFEEWSLSNVKFQTFQTFTGSIVKDSIFIPLRVKIIVQSILDYDPNIVLFTMLHPFNWAIAKKLKKSKKIHIYDIVHDPVSHKGERLWVKFLQKLEMKYPDKIVTLSKTFYYYFKKKNIDVLYIPHPVMHLGNACKEIAEIAKLPKEKVKILFIGRIDKYKGLEYLFEAYSLLENKENAVLIVAGNGKISRRTLPGENKNLLIINRWLENAEITYLIKSCDLVVLPYVHATQSGVLAVAFAHQKPVVVTATGALPEQVEYGKLGLIVPSRDSYALASAMDFFIDNQNQYLKSDFESKVNNSEFFTWENFTKTFFRYEERWFS